MAKSMRERYETARKWIRNDDELSEEERQRILEFLDANNPRRNTHQMPDGKTKSNGTLARYAREIRRMAVDPEPDLTETTAYEINRLMEAYLNGNLERLQEIGKEDGLYGWTVRNKQGPFAGSTGITTT